MAYKPTRAGKKMLQVAATVRDNPGETRHQIAKRIKYGTDPSQVGEFEYKVIRRTIDFGLVALVTAERNGRKIRVLKAK